MIINSYYNAPFINVCSWYTYASCVGNFCRIYNNFGLKFGENDVVWFPGDDIFNINIGNGGVDNHIMSSTPPLTDYIAGLIQSKKSAGMSRSDIRDYLESFFKNDLKIKIYNSRGFEVPYYFQLAGYVIFLRFIISPDSFSTHTPYNKYDALSQNDFQVSYNDLPSYAQIRSVYYPTVSQSMIDKAVFLASYNTNLYNKNSSWYNMFNYPLYSPDHIEYIQSQFYKDHLQSALQRCENYYSIT